MLPFCGYNMADYWGHWLDVGSRASNPPSIFQVNWFRTDAEGKFVWPGFGENMRVLRWVYERVKGNQSGARETAVGVVPTAAAIGASDLGLTTDVAEALLSIDRDDWVKETEDQRVFLDQFGDRLPSELAAQHQALVSRLNRA
jgi:phosphoenolpyruvate carboxykinase (GTP)